MFSNRWILDVSMGTALGLNVKVSLDVLHVPLGPIMRARARKLKDVLNVLIWAEPKQSILLFELNMEHQPCNVLFVAQ